MPKSLRLTSATTPDEQLAYARIVFQHWRYGQFRPILNEFLRVFPVETIEIAAQGYGFNLKAPKKTPFLAFLSRISGSPAFSSQGSEADLLRAIATRLVIESAKTGGYPAPSAPAPIPVRQLDASGEQRALEAFHIFLKNPNDNNHSRLSRLLIVYAASHLNLIKQDYSSFEVRSESIRAFSGGRCSPR